MRESLIYISNAMDVFSTKIAGTLIESHTFDLLSENRYRDLACFVSSGNEFQSFSPSHLKLSFPKETVLTFGPL